MMTTILDLPEEILILIFKKLWPSPPRECQYVCKSWYLPAHTMCLEVIRISFSQIPRFIASIDCNPHPEYLNAIKSISMTANENLMYQYYLHRVIDKEMIEKLFCRFPNLKHVLLDAPSSTFDEFNDEICKAILKKCCKLNRFEIRSQVLNSIEYVVDDDTKRKAQDKYLDAHCKLRLLLTRIQLLSIDFSLRPESSVDYISQFPRLETIYDVPDLNTFQKLLAAFIHLPQLKKIDMRNMLDDQEDFAETFIPTKTKEEQEQLVELLSSVRDLSVHYQGTFGVNSVKFIAKYFTGLHSFGLASSNNQSLSNLQQILLLNTIMDLVCTAKNDGRANFSNLKLENISRYLPDLILKLFRKSNSMTKVFEVKMQKRITESEMVHLSIASTVEESLRKIGINVSPQFNLHNISTMLPPTDDIDVFIIDIDDFYQEYTQEISTSMYDKILTKMPSLKEVTLEIPHSYIQGSSPTTYPFIERATLLATAGEKSQEVLDAFSHKFPNLKQLNIYYFCGVWNEELHEYQVTLPEYSLEKLVLDLTPVKLEMDKNFNSENGLQFIVVKVSVSSNNEQCLYKVSSMYEKAVLISKNDLDGLIFENDYYCIHITVNSLQRLDVYMRDFVSRFDPKYARGYTYDSRLTLFNNL